MVSDVERPTLVACWVQSRSLELSDPPFLQTSSRAAMLEYYDLGHNGGSASHSPHLKIGIMAVYKVIEELLQIPPENTEHRRIPSMRGLDMTKPSG